MSRALIALAVVATAAALLLATRQAANVQAQDSAAAPTGDGSTAFDYINPIGLVESQVESFQVDQSMQDTNTRAFLDMIATSEGTRWAADSYRVCFGYRHTIADLSDHPAVSGEWRGEKLSDAMCKGAGFGPGCVSTAAGRYQLTKPTWLGAKRALGLTDFSAASQDAAAVYLIRQRGAIDEVQAGNLEKAIALCAKEWASLPGAGYGQTERRLSTLTAAYTDAGGMLAVA